MTPFPKETRLSGSIRNAPSKFASSLYLSVCLSVCLSPLSSFHFEASLKYSVDIVLAEERTIIVLSIS